MGSGYFLFITFLLFDLICTPSTTSSAGGSALQLPALVLDDFYLYRGGYLGGAAT